MQALIRMKISGVTFSWGIPSFPSKLLAYSVYRSSTPLIYSAQTLPPLCKYLNGRLYHTAFALILQEVMQEPESFCVKTAGILPAAVGGIVSYGIDKMSSVKNVLDAQAEAVFKACRERVTDTTIQSLIFFWLIETKIHYGVVYYSYEELKSEMNDISIITTNEELKKNQVGKVLFNTGSSFWLQQSSEVPDGHVLRLYAVAKVRILPGPWLVAKQ